MNNLRQIGLVVAGGAIGAGFMWVLQGHTLRVLPGAMAYSDFVAIVLSALSALVAILGIAFAIFAIWGWAQFREIVEKKVEEISPPVLAEDLKNGSTRQVIEDIVTKRLEALQVNPDALKAWKAEQDRRVGDLAEVDDEELDQ